MAHVGNDPACFCLLPVDARAAGRCGNLVHRSNSSVFFFLEGRTRLIVFFKFHFLFLPMCDATRQGCSKQTLFFLFFFIKSANPIRPLIRLIQHLRLLILCTDSVATPGSPFLLTVPRDVFQDADGFSVLFLFFCILSLKGLLKN